MGYGAEPVEPQILTPYASTTMRIIDTHAHLFDEAFADDVDDVVRRARENHVEKVFLPNIDESTLPAMLSLCEAAPDFFYPMLGLHPTEVREDYAEVLARMEKLLEEPHPYIGIGEVGLDYYWDRTYYKEQQDAFCRQVEWSLASGLPLMIHSRSAQKELVDLLAAYRSRGVRGVFHSFCGTPEEARELLSFEGFMIGVNGVLTFKKSALPGVLPYIPPERLVVETDAPYLAPVPFRGKRNESAYVFHTLAKAAEVYGMPVEKLAGQTSENALKLFVRAV